MGRTLALARRHVGSGPTEAEARLTGLQLGSGPRPYPWEHTEHHGFKGHTVWQYMYLVSKESSSDWVAAAFCPSSV